MLVEPEEIDAFDCQRQKVLMIMGELQYGKQLFQVCRPL